VYFFGKKASIGHLLSHKVMRVLCESEGVVLQGDALEVWCPLFRLPQVHVDVVHWDPGVLDGQALAPGSHQTLDVSESLSVVIKICKISGQKKEERISER
jgi:hypothetical protein